MQIKGAPLDTTRVSVSSAVSTSSYGSAQDDNDAFGDVYVWGEIICDNSARISTERNSNLLTTRADILLPTPLESNVVLDIHNVACGVRHAALVTRQGEVFTWGEESGGRLGHGVDTHCIHPRLVESLSACSIDLVACGEFHTCAVSVSGELYTWGDGTHYAGMLGHGNHASHWIPKRVSRPLEGLQVAYVTCGTWHTALITSGGKLFTFGDGTFGVLGHGNKESVLHPREVETLMGLKTIAVSCGVWHTAAVVEVIVTQSSASSGKLFTWGDGDKYRLGHGDKDPRLKPTCVPSLIDYNFYKVVCGHSLTIGLTTIGRIFTMGSTVYGQLGNAQSDGKLPCLVEDKLENESIKEVACGSYHVAVLTTKGEVYTWGKGASGRLGHGDFEDRKSPSLVEALKDRPVKCIACGSNFTAAICYYKWVSGAEQSQCSACRQAFGFTRKRHNCYNCGLVYCHSCSSRKALGAALSPNPGRPYRVCDSCYLKLNKILESGGAYDRKNVLPRISGESKDRFEKVETKITKTALPANLDSIKILDTKPAKQGRKSDSLSSILTPIPPSVQLKDVAFSGVDLYRTFPRPVTTSAIQSTSHSRTVSPFSRKPSPPRSATPIPTMSGLTFSKSATDSLKKTNELLSQELQKLRAQVDVLRRRHELQEFEMQKSSKRAQEAVQLAAEESAKSKAAKDVIKSLTAQLKEMAVRLPHEVYEDDSIRPRHLPNGIHSQAVDHLDPRKKNQLRNEPSKVQSNLLPVSTHSAYTNGVARVNLSDTHETTKRNMDSQRVADANSLNDHSIAGDGRKRETPISAIKTRQCDSKEATPLQRINDSPNPPYPIKGSNQIESEWIEQYEPGVYITLMALQDGTRDLKRVRFSRRRFAEQQAETWWTENREKVYEKYNVYGSERAASSAALSRSPC